MAKKKKQVNNVFENSFAVAGIGASAGGIEAFKLFIRAIPEDSGIAYVFLQHLHPDFESTLSSIMQRETKVPVIEITDNIKLAPDHIYIVPSNKLLIAVDGILKLKPRPQNKEPIHSIDVFFTSLAEVHQSHAIGVVLSGLGTDGTEGLKKIKDYGGITFAQEMESAAFDSMPQHAIYSGFVDFISVPEKMPLQLAELNRTLKSVPDDPAVSEVLKEEDNFRQVISLLRVRRGVDFTYYKQTTIRRRILRRMIIVKAEDIGHYLEILHSNKTEQDILYQDLLIPVTNFFRDVNTFDYLCEEVFPELLKNKSITNPVRIWVAGCSTGEEAYSMAICLSEYLGDKISSLKVQIFATDLSEKNIDKARLAIYNKRELEGVSDTRLKLFFHKADGHYHVKKAIRDMCVFAMHNFLKDPPFARIDLVSCRNVLIYMESYLQKKALSTFHYALKEKGLLLLGKSETVGNASELFSSFTKLDKLYISKPAPGKFISFNAERKEGKYEPATAIVEKKKNDFQRNADDVLLAKYSPAGVVVDEQFDIVQFRGATGDFIEPAPGKASLNILKMAREGLAFEIRNALHKAKTTSEPVTKEDILINQGRLISIEVIPLLDTIELHYLILFRHGTSIDKTAEIHPGEAVSKDTTTPKTVEQLRVSHLEKELAQLREDMRSITEDQEAANEELQSANEELLSGSEELQSLNEELETSKEELQSTNEELMTINQELFDRSEQYNQARLYTETIVKTIHEPLAVLNRDLRIKSANQSFYSKFGLTEEDIQGHILFELQNGKWDIPQLRNPILKIQSGKLSYNEWEVDFPFIDSGTRSFQMNAQMIEGPSSEQMLLLTFDDITLRKKEIETLKKVAESIKNELSVLEGFFMQAPGGFCIFKGPDLIFQFANPKYSDMFGINDPKGKPFDKVFAGEDKSPEFRLLLDVYKTGKPYNASEVLTIIDKGKGIKETIYLDLTYQALKNEAGVVTGVLAFSYDVTEKILRRRQWESQALELEEEVQQRTNSLKEANAELQRSNKNLEQFASIASHDLQEPLRKIQTFTTILRQKHGDSLSDPAKDLVEKINISSGRMSKLVKDVLSYSKITRPESAYIVTDLNAILKNVLEDFDLAIKEKNAIISSTELPVVEAIPLQMNQLFYNLIGNALKFTKAEGAIEISISARKTGANEISTYPGLNPRLEYWELVFKDNGIGFDPQFSEQIFMIFQRLHDRSKYAGTGIGLALCQNIVLSHQGTIRAESREGKGSVFYVILPQKQGGH